MQFLKVEFRYSTEKLHLKDYITMENNNTKYKSLKNSALLRIPPSSQSCGNLSSSNGLLLRNYPFELMLGKSLTDV